MKVDIEKIKEFANQRENENWTFRLHLKGSDIPIEEIDEKVNALYRRYSNETDGTQCGNCWKEVTPILSEHDIHRISDALGISVPEVRMKYGKLDEDGDITFNSKPCPFLPGNICKMYESRPDDCRSYPHLHNGELIFRMGQAFRNCFMCPIVFYVYEGLKERCG